FRSAVGAPSSLRMRPRASAAAHSSPMPRATRVAQPTPDQPTGGDAPVPTPEPTPATEPQGPAPGAAAPAPEAKPPSTSTTADAEAAPVGTEEIVVVTGTLIDQPGFKAPTPMTVIGDAELRQAGRENVGEVLADIPQFRFSINPSLNQGLNTIGSA